MGFSRQEYWSRLSFPSPGNLPDPWIEPRSPALQADSLLSEVSGLQLKKKKFAICSYLDGLGGHYAKWNKSEKDKYCMLSLNVEYKKLQQTSEYNKKKQTHRYRKQRSGYQLGDKVGEVAI